MRCSRVSGRASNVAPPERPVKIPTGRATRGTPDNSSKDFNMNLEPVFAAGAQEALKHFVDVTKLHPILVNFTAALVPISVVTDAIGRLLKDESLRHTGWWTLFFATAITPFTAIAGWLFWMPDDSGVTGMTIHKWLGTGLAVLLFGLFAWRLRLHRQQRRVTVPYLVAGVIFIAALVVQGHLGGQQVFGVM
jgi:uncharacterized membrane protein